MIADTTSLQICVWRPSQFKRKHMDINLGNPIDALSFHEELYKWETTEDVLGSITNVEQTDNLREALVGHFAPDKAAETRTLVTLTVSLNLLDDILSGQEASDWGDVKEVRSLDNGDKLHLRQHQLLAFRQHLQWILDTFSLVPDVYITIR